jgi:hypothetical protein
MQWSKEKDIKTNNAMVKIKRMYVSIEGYGVNSV